MAKIKHLPKEVIDLIAAGEVVERPAQVVKELIENSLDAKATKIEIELVNGGLDLISLTDDGEGMSQQDLEKSWIRHTTSKMSSKDDFEKITSLGFRGEALASIACVSNLLIQSREEYSQVGFRLEIRDGNLVSSRAVGMPVGTTVRVSELFYNFPARKKFLKKSSVELQKVINIVTKLALNNYQIDFVLRNNDKLLISTLHHEKNWKDRILSLLGSKITENLIPVTLGENGYQLNGYISKPQLSRKNKSRQYLFLNSRSITDDKLSKLIKNVYGSLLEPHAYPLFIFDLQVSPNKVDVNVHPQKERVEFLDETDLYFFVRSAVESSLLEHNLTYNFKETAQEKLVLRDRKTIAHTRDSLKENTELFSVKEVMGDEEIIQVDKTYLIYPTKNGLAMIDQHAAHERILFEQFKESYLRSEKNPTKLEKPVLLELDIIDQNELSLAKEILNDLGFQLSLEEKKVFLTHVPYLLLEHDYLSLIMEIIDSRDDNFSRQQIDSQTIRVLNFLACRNAIMSGEYLTMEERKKLIKKLDETKGAYTCPHGRPVRVAISVGELEKIFLRKK